MMKLRDKSQKLVFLLVFLSCMMPRYIGAFKIRIGINVSAYDIAVVLVWALYSGKRFFSRQYEMNFFAVWLIWTVVSVWRSRAINSWAYYVLFLCISIMLMQYLISREDVRIFQVIPRGLAAALMVHLAIGIHDVITHNYLFEVGEFSKRYYGKVGVSVFHNPNDYSTFLIVVFPFVMHLFAQANSALERAVYAAAVIMSVYMLAVNESRVAVLAGTALILIYVFLLTRYSRYKFVIYLSLPVIVVSALNNPVVRLWIFNVLRENSLNLGRSSDMVRWNLIRNGLYFLRRTYGFGVGAGNMYQWLATRSIYSIGTIRYMHNWYVEILATFGVLIFVLYMIFHMRVLKILYTRARDERNILGLHTAYMLSFLCFSIMSISSSTNVYSEWVWMYLAVMGAYATYTTRGQMAFL